MNHMQQGPAQEARAEKQHLFHLAARYCAEERKALERLVRCAIPSVPAKERASGNAVGQGALRLKISWLRGATHLAMSSSVFARGWLRWHYGRTCVPVRLALEVRCLLRGAESHDW